MNLLESFGRALVALKNGAKVRRRAWAPGIFLWLNDSRNVLLIGNGKHWTNYVAQYGESVTDDLLAEDWKVVPQ